MKKIIKICLLAQILILGSINAQTTFSGNIHTEGNQAVKNVTITLFDSDQTSIAQYLSTDGTFSIDAPEGGDYFLSFSKENGPVNGVSTYDLVLMVRHILLIAPFDSYYSILAMDVNASGTISTMDLLLVRKLVLGIVQDFPIPSWLFLEAMDDPTDFSTPPPVNTIPISIATDEVKVLDIIGVKTGDVNGSASGN